MNVGHLFRSAPPPRLRGEPPILTSPSAPSIPLRPNAPRVGTGRAGAAGAWAALDPHGPRRMLDPRHFTVCGAFAVRTVTSWTLIVLIVSCPLFCAADPCDAPAHHVEADGPGSDPSSCPGDSGNCVCKGAVLSVIGRSVDSDSLSLPLPGDCLLPAAGPGLSIHLVHLSHRGWLADPIEPGGALAIRAWLQNFRC